MNIQLFKGKNGFIILVCIIAVILIYILDLFKLAYQVTGWKAFGQTPVTVDQIDYFIADTPDVIGYKEPDSGEMVSCATTVAYVTTDTNDRYRCCDTGGRISCLAGDFSSDIPANDVTCRDQLISVFGISFPLEGLKSYEGFGNCMEGTEPQITVVYVKTDGQILWKYLNVEDITVLNSSLRCIVAPLLIILIVVLIVRSIPKEPIRRF